MSKLYCQLKEFADSLNKNTYACKLLNNWDKSFYICTNDEQQAYEIKIHDNQVKDIFACNFDGINDEALLIQANENILINVFSGELSPLSAYNKGELALYGNMQDQTRLDAIALVLWGA